MSSKNQKFGRNKRTLSGKTYSLSKKWEINKKKKIARAERQKQHHAEKKNKKGYVVRGTARAKRRNGMVRKSTSQEAS